MVTENEDYGPREAFRDFSDYVEEELEAEVPFEDEIEGIGFFQIYEKSAVNALTHLEESHAWFNYLEERSESLDQENEEYSEFLDELDQASEKYFEAREELRDEVYDNGMFDDEAVLSKATPVEMVEGVPVPEIQTFVNEIYEVSDQAKDDVKVLKSRYAEIADSAIEEAETTTYETDQNKPLKTEETEKEIDRIENITGRINSANSQIRENTERM